MLPPKEVTLAVDLAGLRVLVTRTSVGSSSWAASLAAAGAHPLVYPTIETVPSTDLSPLDRQLHLLGTFDGIIFTSATAVAVTLSRPVWSDGLSSPKPAVGCMVVAVGSSTAAALSERGWTATVVPADKRQEGILDALPRDLQGRRFLFPQAAAGRELLPDELRARGAEVAVVPVYETVPCRPLPALPLFDVVVFASPSALRSFADWHGLDVLGATAVVVLGPTTAAAVRGLGLSPAAEASEPSVAGLIAVLASLSLSRSRRPLP